MDIITSFDQPQWDLYAQDMILTAEAFWPKEWRLIVYTGMEMLWTQSTERVSYRPLPESVRFFKERAPKGADGRKRRPCWKKKEIQNGYSYRTDAIRFSHKPLSLIDYVVERYRTDPFPEGTFYWLDADVITIRRPPADWFERTFRKPAVISRLHRPASYSETGYLGFRLPGCKLFFKYLANAYLKGQLYALTQWHDSWVIDWCIKRSQLVVHEMTISNIPHIWKQSPLNHYFDHLKGDRKITRSEETERVIRQLRGLDVHSTG